MTAGQSFAESGVESGAGGTPIQATPELLDQLAETCNISPEVRDAIEQVLAVFDWSFAMVIDGLVNHRGRVHEEKKDVARPSAPEGSLVPYIAARMSLGVLTGSGISNRPAAA